MDSILKFETRTLLTTPEDGQSNLIIKIQGFLENI